LSLANSASYLCAGSLPLACWSSSLCRSARALAFQRLHLGLVLLHLGQEHGSRFVRVHLRRLGVFRCRLALLLQPAHLALQRFVLVSVAVGAELGLFLVDGVHDELQLLRPGLDLHLRLVVLLQQLLVALQLLRGQLVDLLLVLAVDLRHLGLHAAHALLLLLVEQEDAVDLFRLLGVAVVQLLLHLADLGRVRAAAHLVHGQVVVGQLAFQVAHLERHGLVLALQLRALRLVLGVLLDLALQLVDLGRDLRRLAVQFALEEGRVLHLSTGASATRADAHSHHALLGHRSVGHVHLRVEADAEASGLARCCWGLLTRPESPG